MKVEEKALVLDFLSRGRSSDFKTEPFAQVIGKEFFTLLEVVPKKDVELKSMDEVYVGKEERKEIDFIKRRIPYSKLTNNAMSELEEAVKKIVLENEKKFVDFYNNSRSITLKRHQIELLPGMGKKHMLQVIQEREKGPFSSFEDIKKRVSSIPMPATVIVKRIIEEIDGLDIRHYLFVRPPFQDKPPFKKRF